MFTQTSHPGATADQTTAFNWPMALRTSLGSLCLLGFSSRSGADWMSVAAGALMLYTIAVPAPIWRMVQWSHVRSIVARLPHVAAFGAAIILAGLLADAPVPLLADLGSFTFIIVLLAGAIGVAALVIRAVLAVISAVPRIAGRISQKAHFYSSLAWLALTG